MQMKSQRRYRIFLIVLVYLVAAIYSIGLGISSEVRQRDLLYSFIIAFLFTQICIVDSRIYGKPLPPNSFWLVLMFYPIAVPILIIRAHGIKGIGFLIIHLLGLILVSIVFCLITTRLVYGSFFAFEDF